MIQCFDSRSSFKRPNDDFFTLINTETGEFWEDYPNNVESLCRNGHYVYGMENLGNSFWVYNINMYLYKFFEYPCWNLALYGKRLDGTWGTFALWHNGVVMKFVDDWIGFYGLYVSNNNVDLYIKVGERPDRYCVFNMLSGTILTKNLINTARHDMYNIDLGSFKRSYIFG